MKNDELKNGTELLLSLVLSLDLLEQYEANQLLKRQINTVKKTLEKTVSKHYDKVYKEGEEFIQNSLSYKEETIKKFAKYNEADSILCSHYLDFFDKNIEIARKKGVIFFDKII